MPGRYPDSGSRIFQGLVLQPLRSQPQLPPQRQEAILVGAHEVDHPLAADPVSVKPHAAVEGEAHPLAAACEFPNGRLYEQEIRPSVVALPTGVAVPENR